MSLKERQQGRGRAHESVERFRVLMVEIWVAKLPKHAHCESKRNGAGGSRGLAVWVVGSRNAMAQVQLGCLAPVITEPTLSFPCDLSLACAAIRYFAGRERPSRRIGKREEKEQREIHVINWTTGKAVMAYVCVVDRKRTVGYIKVVRGRQMF